MKENWSALAIAAYYTLLPEQAFTCYEKGYLSKFKHGSICPPEIMDIMALREEGKTWKEIGQKYNIKPHTAFMRLRRYLDKQGVDLKKPYTEEDVKSIIQMREEGYEWKEIGDCFGITASAALQRAQRWEQSQKEACLK